MTLRSEAPEKATPAKVSPRPGRVLAVGVLLASSFFKPLLIWSANAWDITFPWELLIASAATFLVAVTLWLVVKRLLRSETTAALGSAAVVLILLHWYQLEFLHPVAWLGVVGGVILIVNVWATEQVVYLLAVVFVAGIGLGPLLQLGIEHVSRAEPYPIKEMTRPTGAVPTEAVEDIVVVVPDSYPALVVAENRFGHDPGSLREALSNSDFTVVNGGLSRNTFTGLAIPSLLELQLVVDEGDKGGWRNRSSIYDIIRGNSFTHHALALANFRSVHVEGGWNGSKCGDEIDVCVRGSWLDESFWLVLNDSVLRRPLLNRYGSYAVSGSIGALAEVQRLLEEMQGDGNHDFLFAHLMLPHPPSLVDPDCAVRPDLGIAVSEVAEADSSPEREFADQLACVDGLLAPLAGAISPGTAVLIAADHGTGAGGQVFAPAEEWSDEDIAERFGILLAYRMPPGCSDPADTTNVDVMRAIVGCAIEVDLPDRSTEFMIGGDVTEPVDPDRMSSIRDRLASLQGSDFARSSADGTG